MQKERLRQYLAQSPVLQALYFAKQQLNGFLVMKSLKAKRAKQMLPQFLALIRQFEQSPAKALAATLRSWLEPIVRMWRFSEHDLVDLARALHEHAEEEVDDRAAISRAYYAAYHRCLDFHSQLPYPGKDSRNSKAGVHERLIHRLCNPTVPNQALSMHSCALGQKLQTLKKRRYEADYLLRRTVSPRAAELAIFEVEDLMRFTQPESA